MQETQIRLDDVLPKKSCEKGRKELKLILLNIVRELGVQGKVGMCPGRQAAEIPVGKGRIILSSTHVVAMEGSVRSHWQVLWAKDLTNPQSLTVDAFREAAKAIFEDACGAFLTDEMGKLKIEWHFTEKDFKPVEIKDHEINGKQRCTPAKTADWIIERIDEALAAKRLGCISERHEGWGGYGGKKTIYEAVYGVKIEDGIDQLGGLGYTYAFEMYFATDRCNNSSPNPKDANMIMMPDVSVGLQKALRTRLKKHTKKGGKYEGIQFQMGGYGYRIGSGHYEPRMVVANGK